MLNQLFFFKKKNIKIIITNSPTGFASYAVAVGTDSSHPENIMPFDQRHILKQTDSSAVALVPVAQRHEWMVVTVEARTYDGVVLRASTESIRVDGIAPVLVREPSKLMLRDRNPAHINAAARDNASPAAAVAIEVQSADGLASSHEAVSVQIPASATAFNAMVTAVDEVNLLSKPLHLNALRDQVPPVEPQMTCPEFWPGHGAIQCSLPAALVDSGGSGVATVAWRVWTHPEGQLVTELAPQNATGRYTSGPTAVLVDLPSIQHDVQVELLVTDVAGNTMPATRLVQWLGPLNTSDAVLHVEAADAGPVVAAPSCQFDRGCVRVRWSGLPHSELLTACRVDLGTHPGGRNVKSGQATRAEAGEASLCTGELPVAVPLHASLTCMVKPTGQIITVQARPVTVPSAGAVHVAAEDGPPTGSRTLSVTWHTPTPDCVEHLEWAARDLTGSVEMRPFDVVPPADGRAEDENSLKDNDARTVVSYMEARDAYGHKVVSATAGMQRNAARLVAGTVSDGPEGEPDYDYALYPVTVVQAHWSGFGQDVTNGVDSYRSESSIVAFYKAAVVILQPDNSYEAWYWHYVGTNTSVDFIVPPGNLSDTSRFAVGVRAYLPGGQLYVEQVSDGVQVILNASVTPGTVLAPSCLAHGTDLMIAFAGFSTTGELSHYQVTLHSLADAPSASAVADCARPLPALATVRLERDEGATFNHTLLLPGQHYTVVVRLVDAQGQCAGAMLPVGKSIYIDADGPSPGTLFIDGMLSDDASPDEAWLSSTTTIHARLPQATGGACGLAGLEYRLDKLIYPDDRHAVCGGREQWHLGVASTAEPVVHTEWALTGLELSEQRNVRYRLVVNVTANSQLTAAVMSPLLRIDPHPPVLGAETTFLGQSRFASQAFVPSSTFINFTMQVAPAIGGLGRAPLVQCDNTSWPEALPGIEPVWSLLRPGATPVPVTANSSTELVLRSDDRNGFDTHVVAASAGALDGRAMVSVVVLAPTATYAFLTLAMVDESSQMAMVMRLVCPAQNSGARPSLTLEVYENSAWGSKETLPLDVNPCHPTANASAPGGPEPVQFALEFEPMDGEYSSAQLRTSVIISAGQERLARMDGMPWVSAQTALLVYMHLDPTQPTPARVNLFAPLEVQARLEAWSVVNFSHPDACITTPAQDLESDLRITASVWQQALEVNVSVAAITTTEHTQEVWPETTVGRVCRACQSCRSSACRVDCLPAQAPGRVWSKRLQLQGPWPLPVGGNFRLRYCVHDSAGNKQCQNSTPFEVDAQPPAVAKVHVVASEESTQPVDSVTRERQLFVFVNATDHESRLREVSWVVLAPDGGVLGRYGPRSLDQQAEVNLWLPVNILQPWLALQYLSFQVVVSDVVGHQTSLETPPLWVSPAHLPRVVNITMTEPIATVGAGVYPLPVGQPLGTTVSVVGPPPDQLIDVPGQLALRPVDDMSRDDFATNIMLPKPGARSVVVSQRSVEVDGQVESLTATTRDPQHHILSLEPGVFYETVGRFDDNAGEQQQVTLDHTILALHDDPAADVVEAAPQEADRGFALTPDGHAVGLSSPSGPPNPARERVRVVVPRRAAAPNSTVAVGALSAQDQQKNYSTAKPYIVDVARQHFAVPAGYQLGHNLRLYPSTSFYVSLDGALEGNMEIWVDVSAIPQGALDEFGLFMHSRAQHGLQDAARTCGYGARSYRRGSWLVTRVCGQAAARRRRADEVECPGYTGGAPVQYIVGQVLPDYLVEYQPMLRARTFQVNEDSQVAVSLILQVEDAPPAYSYVVMRPFAYGDMAGAEDFTNSGNFVYRPRPNFSGQDQMCFAVHTLPQCSDAGELGYVSSREACITMNVTAQPDDPVLLIQSGENGPVGTTLDPITRDMPGDPTIIYTIVVDYDNEVTHMEVTPPQAGHLTLLAEDEFVRNYDHAALEQKFGLTVSPGVNVSVLIRRLAYQPNAEAYANDSFQVKGRDSSGALSATVRADIQIYVNPCRFGQCSGAFNPTQPCLCTAVDSTDPQRPVCVRASGERQPLFTCTCDRGWTGRLCNINVDNCTKCTSSGSCQATCANNGTCTDLVDDFACSCASSHTGRTCEQCLNRHAPRFLQPYDLQVNVTELLPIGARVAELIVTDADADECGSINCTLRQKGRQFAIHKVNDTACAITLAAHLDHETVVVHDISVTVYDHGVPAFFATTHIQVNVLNANEHSPTLVTPLTETLTVLETAPPGTALFQLGIADGDRPDTSFFFALDYQLATPLAQLFNVTASGLLVVAGNLAIHFGEGRPGRVLVPILISDRPFADPSGHTTAVQLSLDVQDVNDSPPTCSPGAVTASVRENSAVGTFVYTLNCSDPDTGVGGQLQYTLLGPSGAPFVVAANTGLITVGASVDRESLVQIELLVLVVDGISRAYSTPDLVVRVNVLVLDVNDNAPQFAQLPLIYTVFERHPPPVPVASLGEVLSDNDEAGTANARIACRLHTQDLPIEHRDKLRMNESSCEVFVQPGLPDQAYVNELQLRVTAYNPGAETANTSTTVMLIIRITDEQTHAPRMLTQAKSVPVRENTFLATGENLVTVVHAADTMDAPSNAQVQYCLMTGAGECVQSLGSFMITTNSNAGHVRLREALDYEKAAVHTLNVSCFDTGLQRNPWATVTLWCPAPLALTVVVEDVNDNKPLFEVRRLASVPEQADRQLVADVLVRDGDLGFGVSVSLQNDTASAFELQVIAPEDPTVPRNPVVAQIYAGRALDREKLGSTLHVTLRATDMQLPLQTSDLPLVVTLEDINDNAPTMVASGGYQVTIEEHSPPKPLNVTPVLQATDADEGANALLVLELVDVRDRRTGSVCAACLSGLAVATEPQPAIRNATGRLRLVNNSQLDRELYPDGWDVQVRFVNPSSQQYGPVETVRLDIADIDDNPTVFATGQLVVQVAENSDPGTLLAVPVLKDADLSANWAKSFLIENVTGADGSNLAHKVQLHDGQLQLAQTLDSETLPDTFRIWLVMDDRWQNRMVVVVNIKNINDNLPQFDRPAYVFGVPENRAGHHVGELWVQDTDGLANMRWRLALLESRDAGKFVLTHDQSEAANASGRGQRLVLALATGTALDYEEARSIQVTVQADEIGPDGGVLVQTAAVTVEVLDENDEAPVFGHTRYVLPPVPECAVCPGIFLSTQPANLANDVTDKDTTGEPLELRVEGTTAVRFEPFLGNTYALRLVGPLDYETEREVVFNVTVSDGRHQGWAEVRMPVTNVNDNTPEKPEGGEFKCNVSEAAAVGDVVCSLALHDGDGDALSYVLLGRSSQDLSVHSTTGQLYVHRLLDFDDGLRRQYDLMLQVQDQGQVHQTVVTVTVTVLDANDLDPEFASGQYFGTVPEHAAAGTKVLFAHGPAPAAVDRDTVAQPLTYSLHGPDASWFTVDANTGQLSVSNTGTVSLDREQLAEAALELRATDAGGREAAVPVAVALQDVNDHVPTCHWKLVDFVEENQAPVQVATLSFCTDQDSDHANQEVEFYTNTPNFEVDASSGNVTMNVSVDYEEGTEVQVEVCYRNQAAAPNGSVAVSTCKPYTISVRGANDNMPVWDKVNASCEMLMEENMALNSTARCEVELTASDADVETTGGQPEFEIVSVRYASSNTACAACMQGLRAQATAPVNASLSNSTRALQLVAITNDWADAEQIGEDGLLVDVRVIDNGQPVQRNPQVHTVALKVANVIEYFPVLQSSVDELIVVEINNEEFSEGLVLYTFNITQDDLADLVLTLVHGDPAGGLGTTGNLSLVVANADRLEFNTIYKLRLSVKPVLPGQNVDDSKETSFTMRLRLVQPSEPRECLAAPGVVLGLWIVAILTVLACLVRTDRSYDRSSGLRGAWHTLRAVVKEFRWQLVPLVSLAILSVGLAFWKCEKHETWAWLATLLIPIGVVLAKLYRRGNRSPSVQPETSPATSPANSRTRSPTASSASGQHSADANSGHPSAGQPPQNSPQQPAVLPPLRNGLPPSHSPSPTSHPSPDQPPARECPQVIPDTRNGSHSPLPASHPSPDQSPVQGCPLVTPGTLNGPLKPNNEQAPNGRLPPNVPRPTSLPRNQKHSQQMGDEGEVFATPTYRASNEMPPTDAPLPNQASATAPAQAPQANNGRRKPKPSPYAEPLQTNKGRAPSAKNGPARPNPSRGANGANGAQPPQGSGAHA